MDSLRGGYAAVGNDSFRGDMCCGDDNEVVLGAKPASVRPTPALSGLTFRIESDRDIMLGRPRLAPVGVDSPFIKEVSTPSSISAA